MKIPFKETGGRTGNRLYQQLCDMVRPLALVTRSVLTFVSRLAIPTTRGLPVIHGSPGVNGTRKTRLGWM